ncbi:PAS domain-containing sensor histidine kinase [Pontibacter chitinilyticus]|uniref:PAS domain-containing sensor histidine kinase n=1 Tax=Pontibacter chitinilyticus TaxID=2674989 RepID=UPI00321B489C
MLSTKFYSSIVSNSTDLISVIDHTGRYSYVGASVAHILGYSIEELTGRSAFDFIHPEDFCAASTALAAIAQHQQVRLAPFRFRNKAGAWRWIDCSISNMLENEAVKGFVTNSRDITETVEAEYQKEQQQAFYESLFFEHPDAVFTLNNQGIFQQINRHVAKITGISENETIGTHFVKFLHPEDTEETAKAFLRVLQGEALTLETRILDAAQRELDLSVTLMPVYFRGTISGVQGIARDITEVKRSEQLIKDQAAQLKKIVESITDPFLAFDAEWRYTYANQPFAAFMGKQRDELLGQVVWDMYPDAKSSRFYQQCLQVAQSKVATTFEETFQQFANATLSFSIFPADGGIAVHFVDVTTQKAVHTELEKLSLVASKTTNGVIITDKDGKVEWVNEGFTRITGYSLAEALHHKPGQLLQIPETDRETIQRVHQKLAQAVPFSEEILNARKNGERVWFLMDITPILDEAGQVVKFIAIQTDVTEKKAAEAEQQKLTNDLFKHNRDLQQFTYIVSHNLRAPVANAIGLAGLVNKVDKNTPLFDKTLQKLETSIHQLDQVIKDINHILTMRDYNRHLHREEVHLLAVCQEVLGSMEDKLTSMQALVTVAVDASYSMLSSKAYLYSILYNLVSNAIKYSAPHRILALHIAAHKDKRGYVLTVADNGLGMEMHVVQTQLFKLYKRFHPNTHGKGIGLFLVKTQVETLGGKIDVQSAPDKGTTFTLYLGAKHV